MVGNLARSCFQPILTEKAIMEELSEEHHRRLQVVNENIKDLTEFLQGNPDRIQEVMDHFPSINYNGVKWAIATVTHLEENNERPVTIAERTMLVTLWIWEEEHYIHAMEYVKVQSVKEYLTGVATCRSFKGFRISQQTAGPWRTLAIPRPSCRATAGPGKHSSRWCRRRIIFLPLAFHCQC
jgi:hypothetical protein